MNTHCPAQTRADSQPEGDPNPQLTFSRAIMLCLWIPAVLVATLVTFMLPESFSSTARIKIERDHPDIAGLAGPQGPMPYDPYFIQTEFEMIQSEVILGKVIASLDLNKDWGRKYGGGDPLKTTETMQLLKGRMDLGPVRNTSLIEIRVFSEKAEEAAKIANAVALAYKAHRLAQRTTLSMGGIKALEERIAEQDEKVRKAQQVVDDLRIKLNISDTMVSTDSPSLLMTAETVRKLESLRVETQAEYNRQRALQSGLRPWPEALGRSLLLVRTLPEHIYVISRIVS